MLCVATIYGNIFTAHIVNIWNRLPNSVVDANSINAFRARLDKFWLHQEVMFDFRLLMILVEPETDQYCHKVLLGPFYGAITVPSVTHCRCHRRRRRCRRRCGHRCAGGVRQHSGDTW